VPPLHLRRHHVARLFPTEQCTEHIQRYWIDFDRGQQEPAERPVIKLTFGWMKAVAGLRKAKLRGLLNIDRLFVLTAAAFDLWRILKLRSAL
jgi:hypothetical protein